MKTAFSPRCRVPLAALLLTTFALGCGGGGSAAAKDGAVANSPAVVDEPSISTASAEARTATPFTELVDKLSEPDGPFFSDNVISNETSYLQVAAALEKGVRPGGAYIGVGPEQNFSYIALTKPSIAFVVDIRRQNLILHLLYKGCFEEATSRAHFVALLLGRPYEPAGDPGADANVEAVLGHATRRAADEASFTDAHARIAARLRGVIALDAADRRALELAHRSFFRGQLGTRFSLHEKNGRLYPTLAELLKQQDPTGAQRGFLAREESFRTLQAMQREGRIVPLVGDFAGERAMPGVASWLRERKIAVSTFYVSNVEQYLFEPKVWAKWSRNVAAMPVDERSVFVRAYLDQGRRHPLQMAGHRTATVLQRMVDFDKQQQKRPYGSFWAVATEKYAPPG